MSIRSIFSGNRLRTARRNVIRLRGARRARLHNRRRGSGTKIYSLIDKSLQLRSARLYRVYRIFEFFLIHIIIQSVAGLFFWYNCYYILPS